MWRIGLPLPRFPKPRNQGEFNQELGDPAFLKSIEIIGLMVVRLSSVMDHGNCLTSGLWRVKELLIHLSEVSCLKEDSSPPTRMASADVGVKV
jgi:hypothetical protein